MEYPYRNILYIKFLVDSVCIAWYRIILNLAQPQMLLQNCNHNAVIYWWCSKFTFLQSHKVSYHCYFIFMYWPLVTKKCVFHSPFLSLSPWQ